MLILFLCGDVFSQNYNYGRMIYMRNNPLKRYPSFGLGLGGNMLLGDFGSVQKLSPFAGAQFFIDHRMSESIGYSFQVGGGLYRQLYKPPYHAAAIQSAYFTGEFHLQWFVNKAFNLSLRTRFYPFLTAGVGLMNFNPKADMKDGKGNFYFGWPDGTIRIEPWTGFNDDVPKIKRDNVFETTLDPKGEYDHFALIMPVGAGIKYFASRKVELVAGAKVYYTTTDYLDHLVGFTDVGEPSQFNKNNDAMFFIYFAVYYNSGKYKPKRMRRPTRRILPKFMF